MEEWNWLIQNRWGSYPICTAEDEPLLSKYFLLKILPLKILAFTFSSGKENNSKKEYSADLSVFKKKRF